MVFPRPKANRVDNGEGFGLVPTSKVSLNSTEYLFVSVEFDTYQNYWDPRVNHVGVNINSVVSNTYIKWSADVSERIVYNCSIEYSSKNNNLNVYKGSFKDSNSFAAIKRISADSRQGIKQYSQQK